MISTFNPKKRREKKILFFRSNLLATSQENHTTLAGAKFKSQNVLSFSAILWMGGVVS